MTIQPYVCDVRVTHVSFIAKEYYYIMFVKQWAKGNNGMTLQFYTQDLFWWCEHLNMGLWFVGGGGVAEVPNPSPLDGIKHALYGRRPWP